MLFLASVIEQMDLALEHASKGDIHNARFALMLTDNAVELVLHQIAKDRSRQVKSWLYRDKPYPHQKALDRALGRSFDDKLKFAKIEQKIDDEYSQTIAIMHELRNELYHTGVNQEEIIERISKFYIDIACQFIGRYRPDYIGWSSNLKIPVRAQKYLGQDDFRWGREGFSEACASLASQCAHSSADTIAALADKLNRTIEDADTCVQIVADGVYAGQQRTRDRAVVETQAWSIAFSDEGKKFAATHGWKGSVGGLVDWLADTYPFKFKRDPIPSWRSQAAKLRAQQNPHAALQHYWSFMGGTQAIRDMLGEAAAAAEAEIDAATDRALEARAFERG